MNNTRKKNKWLSLIVSVTIIIALGAMAAIGMRVRTSPTAWKDRQDSCPVFPR